MTFYLDSFHYTHNTESCTGSKVFTICRNCYYYLFNTVNDRELPKRSDEVSSSLFMTLPV